MAKKSRVKHAWIAETLSRHAEKLINRNNTSPQAPASNGPLPTDAPPQQAAVAHTIAGLSPEERQHWDSALEYDAIVLLSKLEQLLIRLDDTMIQSSTPLILEYLSTLTNSVVEFAERPAERQVTPLSLEALLRRDTQNYHQLGLHHIRNNRLDVDTLILTCGRPGTHEYPQAFHLICTDLLRVLNIFLMVYVKAFYSPAMRKQWKIVYTGFFVHLATTLRTIQVQVKQRG
jgi:hypothetical protein